ncbi:MAG: family 1 glycosylhydrolase [Candidatus Nitrosopolaris sp.]
MLRTHDFLWGASTSSYQVEGGITNNDWSHFTTSELIRRRISSLTRPNLMYKDSTKVSLQPAGDATKAWDPQFYINDFDLAKSMGMNSFRIGIEWARIEPNKDQWDQGAIDHYKEMISCMSERGLKPVITLNHLTLPLWICTPPDRFTKKIAQKFLPSLLRDLPLADPPPSDPYWKSFRGWENYDTVKSFIKFVTRVVLELKDQVDYWVTISEPVASVIGLGYIAGLWPPGFLLDGYRAKKVLHNLIEAHIEAYNIITALDNIDADGDGISKMVGFSHAMVAVSPAEPTKILGATLKDNIQAAANFDYFVNDYFINAIINGEDDLNYLNTLQRHNKDSKDFIIHEEWKNKSDFIGINYYRRVYVRYSNILALSSAKFVGGPFINNLHTQTHHQSHSILNDLGWEIYPEGLYKLIMRIKNQWKNTPVFITENGVADKSDRYRAPFIVAHLQQVKRAIDNGANVIGYLHWSFMDNYEWLDSYRPESKFGLFGIDRDVGKDGQPDFKRHRTRGAEALEFIIKRSLFPKCDLAQRDSVIITAKDKFGTFSANGSHIIND